MSSSVTTYTSAYRLQAQAIVDEMIARGISLGGGGGGGGDANAYNQTLEIARLEAIRDRLPALLIDGRLVVDSSGVTQPISGVVSVNNLPTTQQVFWTTPQQIAGNVNIGNFPATQQVAGSVNVGNFPTTQPVSGSVSVGNFPATQPISGSVGINNFPTTQAISGSVSVANFPATQAISGTVGISNFPATQPISGSVGVNNFPATQAISATALPLPNGATTESTLALIPARIGNTTDTTATTDTGTFSLIALFKRYLSLKLPSALSNDRLKTESQLTTVARTTSFINTTTTGTIAAGASSVAIANIGSAAGSVKTVSLPAGATISFAANGNDILDAIAYSATGTNFLITTVV